MHRTETVVRLVVVGGDSYVGYIRHRFDYERAYFDFHCLYGYSLQAEDLKPANHLAVWVDQVLAIVEIDSNKVVYDEGDAVTEWIRSRTSASEL